MKIAIFGGTGRVGKIVLQRALQEGHEVSALVRSVEKVTAHDNLSVYEGDVKNEQDVIKTIEGADIVFSALGTDKTTTLTEAVPHMLKAMAQQGITRIVTIGTAGILQSHTDSSKLRYEAGDSNRRLTFAAEEHHKVYDLLQASSTEWTIICPTYLPDGEAEGQYRVVENYIPENAERITVGDVANFTYEELMNGNYIGSRVGIAY